MPESESTTCAISGAGPAGVMLGLLLARAGVQVTVLEKHGDFLRDFRGDTVHPSTLQLLDELGLVEDLERIPHRNLTTLRMSTLTRTLVDADLRRFPSTRKYRHIAMIPQWDFLTLLVEHARRYPAFRLLMNAETLGPIEHGGAIRGLRYRDARGEHDLRAVLTVAADGRRSDLRRAAGMIPLDFGAPMDVLWLRVSRRPDDDEGGGLAGHIGKGEMAAAIDRGDYWQIAFLIPKGSYQEIRAQGLEGLRERLARLLPFLADRVDEIDDWGKVAFLEVGVNRLRRWDRPGLLAIGDAAHTMSPIGGVGINLAVQDAVATANLLAEPLHRAQADPARFDKTLNPRLVQRVQRRRMIPTVGTQFVQLLAQRRLVGRILDGEEPRMPAILSGERARRLMSQLLVRIMVYGILPEHVRTPDRAGADTPKSGVRHSTG
ncbi:FAD-dependent oxidoreductase [Microtetraspora sp. AC03309]|uniref:FAD-dependent oxidoreductase n=1 Tax=Microtetraspora sp. AC03309 TaxID=2779376 RepID=UPI001E41A0F0|nr:FAD-dependent oxidoreductase [Microtetraspora sp. AC03309]MCC5574843.1 FAD-dependent oxidoreductase [Microtetraspora sp. AC03309]